MYLNVCCAININVYNIFYNTEEADLVVRYELIIGRNVAFEIYFPVICMFFLSIRKALEVFTVNRFSMYI